MDVKEYIASGLLEAYALGSLTQAERQRVEADVALNPELATELEAIEAAMLQYATAQAQEPPAGLADKIWAELQMQGAGENDAPKQPRVIPFEPAHRKRVEWRYAALWLLLVGSLAINVYLMYQGRLQQAQKTELADKVEKLQAGQQKLTDMVNSYEATRSMMADTAMQTIVMHTVVKGHPMAATVYWRKQNGETYVSMDALPKPPRGKQYQLWVIQGGKPVDMGVLPNDMANTPVLQKVSMKVMSGEAFAISLEKQGGNAAPTEVYVMGKV